MFKMTDRIQHTKNQNEFISYSYCVSVKNLFLRLLNTFYYCNKKCWQLFKWQKSLKVEKDDFDLHLQRR